MANHFIDVLDELRGRIGRMTAMVQQSVELAVDALFNANHDTAQQVIDGDRRIDQEEVQVERAAIDLLALYQPAASDLRLIATVIKVNLDFERIADCAVNIAQRVLPLARTADYTPPKDLQLMCNSVLSTLADTSKAFNLLDDALARQVLRGDDIVDALYHQIVQDMLTQMESERQNANADLSNIMIAKNLERIGDHCTNVAEAVIYVHSGRIIRHLRTVV